MEKRPLGRLGHESSVLIYGAAALADVTQEVADASVQEALDAGINHFDVAADYGDAELRLGACMPPIRDQIFLATKTGEREYEAAWAQINRSLERLQTDHLDLIQLHAVCDFEALDRVCGDDSALKAALRAQSEGMVTSIGITGHGPYAPAVHTEALRRFPFDTVLTPLNHALSKDEVYYNSFRALTDRVIADDVGLMVIKSVARRNWPDDARGYTTWYQPLDEQNAISAAVAWVLWHLEVTGIATPSDVGLLSLMIQAEREHHAYAAGDIEDALNAVEDYSSPFLAMPF